MKIEVSHTVIVALMSAGVTALANAGVAHADQQRAPIRYASPASSNASTQTAPPSQVSGAPQASVTANRRVEFLYPGETPVPANVTPVGPMSQAVTEAPGKIVLNAQPNVVFGTSRLAGGPVESAAMNNFPASKPVTSNAAAPTQPIRIASLKTDAPAKTGTPLTLSRVKVNRDAPVGEERVRAGIYADGFNGAPTANGEIFDEGAMTAAHPSLPLPSLIQVINEDNRREIVVRVNDRGPFDGQRVLELSPRAGTVLGMSKTGTANVRIRYLGPAPVKQNPKASEPAQPDPQSFASNSVEDESLPPVAMQPRPLRAPMPSTTVADYGEPSLGVPDPVEAMPASSPIAAGNVFIQAGAFADISNAQSLTRALGRGQSVRIEEARVNGGDYFRVLIGPFPTTQAAEIQRSQLSRAGIVDGFLTTR